ncbi:hypothetical protein [Geodermatophilus amargosae]|uniref:hypothetical protein n=1 Tax=Geodermatophilus amargosae TaxID=1296565 RepID=UPI0034DF7FB4
MHLSLRARTCCVLFGSVALTLAAVTPAVATGDDPPPAQPAPAAPGPEGGGAPAEWPPADTGGAWLPVPPEIAEMEQAVQACGSTVVISPGDVAEVEYQAMHQPDGTIRIEFRGAATTDVTRESDGAVLDELDTGGPATDIISADGATVTYSADGPAIIGAFDEVEVAAFAGQGLPPLFYYTSGNTTERVVFEDVETFVVASAEFLTDTARGVQDVCDMLDAAAG